MRAVVTGMGAVTALGRGVARQWAAMAAGEDGIRPIERFGEWIARSGSAGPRSNAQRCGGRSNAG